MGAGVAHAQPFSTTLDNAYLKTDALASPGADLLDVPPNSPAFITTGASGIAGTLPIVVKKFTGTLEGRVALKDVRVGERTCASGQGPLTPKWEAKKVGSK